jgi:hypothetical protein
VVDHAASPPLRLSSEIVYKSICYRGFSKLD